MEKYAKTIIDSWSAMKQRNLNQYVNIDEEAIDVYVEELRKKQQVVCHWDFANIHPKNDNAFASFALVTSAVNFCYTLLENPQHRFTVQDDELFHGAMAMFRCFFRCFAENSITADKLQSQFEVLENTKQFFQGVNNIPLLEERHWIMREVYEVLQDKFSGNPLHVYEEASWDAVKLVDVLAKSFPVAFGSDVSTLHFANESFTFPFFKKAKLVALLYQGRALKPQSKLKTLQNIHELIAVEDYRVPQFLHHIGILQYNSQLKEKIAQQKILLPQHSMELEIRAATTVANSQILRKLNQEKSPDDRDYWNIIHLDYQEWFGGQQVTFPHHLTPTTTY